jgi:hypothetical protein
LQTFVRNRVSQINSLTLECMWRHVPSQETPADIVSRRLYPRELLDCKLSWNGLEFLLNPESEWP